MVFIQIATRGPIKDSCSIIWDYSTQSGNVYISASLSNYTSNMLKCYY